jgi:hypothetical protein
MSDSEPEVKSTKRKPTEKQLENLRKGFAVIKAKREELAKKKEEVKTKIEKGELPEDTPIPKRELKPRISKSKPLRTPVEVQKPEPETVVKPSVPRKKHVSKVSLQLDSLKQEMMAMIQKPAEVKTEVVEKIVEKPVERVVQKERVVSGSELLNKIFNL